MIYTTILRNHLQNFLFLIMVFFWGNLLYSQDNIPDIMELLPDDKRIEGGFLEVPENHYDQESRKIQIAYVIVKSQDPTSDAYPMILFSGGPGGNTLDTGMVKFMLQFPLTANRDLILFDQRGIGYSSPLPDMGFESFDILAANANEAEELELNKAMISRYKAICEEKGIHPEHYNTIQNAMDVGMLFDHLGYGKYNLFGGSYGTRLARVVQDMFPEHIHSSILDSPSPLSTDFLMQRLESYELSLSRIFEYCNNNAECKVKYPNLKEDYFKAINALKDHPIKVSLKDSSDFYINAQDGIYLLRRLLYQADSREKGPELIQALKKGEGEILAQIIQSEYNLTSALNLTMLLSVEKFENFNPTNSTDKISNAYQKHPLIPAKLGFFDAFYQAGMQWHDGHMPIEKRKFKASDVPSLIFVNRFDPVTPPKYGYLFMEKLSRGQLFVLDEGGHGGGNQQCKMEVMIEFMDNPDKALDTSCLNIYKR